MALSVSELREEVLRRLRTMMTIDAAFVASVDPQTLLFTGAIQEQPLASAVALFLENEFGQRDINKFAELAAAPEPVASLDTATRDHRERSLRYREIMAPLGLGDELRVALRTNSSTWGVMCLHREDGPRGFDQEEQRILAALSPHIAEGLRQATLLEEAAHEPAEAGPGVIVLAPDLSVAAITPAAERLVREIASDWPSAGALPVPIYAVAARLLARRRSPEVVPPPRVTVRGSGGHWLTLHASHLRGRAPGVVVVVEPAHPADEVPIMLLAYGLTTREAEIARLIVRGYSTRQVVDRLHISRYTVQDHLKAVFDKLGVRSRRELVAQLLGQRHN